MLAAEHGDLELDVGDHFEVLATRRTAATATEPRRSTRAAEEGVEDVAEVAEPPTEVERVRAGVGRDTLFAEFGVYAVG